MRPKAEQRWPGPERRGAIMVLLGFSLVVLFLFLGVVVDIGFVYHDRRLEQKAVDAAAIAAATEIYRGQGWRVDASARAAATSHGFTHGVRNATVNVYHGPVSGKFIGNVQFAEVVIERPRVTFFARLIGHNTLPTRARAVAGVALPGNRCLYALDRTAEKALNISSNSHVTVGCGVAVNSSNSKALSVTSGSTLDATGGSILVTGGTEGSGWTPAPITGVTPEPDPLAYLPRPTDEINGPCDYTKVKVDGPGVTTLNPGVYCGDGGFALEVTSNGKAFLNPGLYILKGGGLKVGGGSIEGYNVTIVNTNAPASQGGADKFGKIDIGSKSDITLTASTEGDLAGVLFYQDPLAGKPGDKYENIISSETSMNLVGALYFPTQHLILAHSGSTAYIDGAVVARTVDVTSGSTVTFTSASGSTIIKRISLVE